MMKCQPIAQQDQKWMMMAIALARQALNNNEVPVGAVLVKHGKMIASGFNQPIVRCDPTAHAEMIAIRESATLLQNYRLLDTTLYVTLEPCAMCMGAILHARVHRLVFGAWDLRAGAVNSVFSMANHSKLNHRLLCTDGVMIEECQELMVDFFRKRRKHSVF